MDGNQAGGRGGALALLTCGARVYDSALSGNTARLSGGGVAAGHQASTLQPEVRVRAWDCWEEGGSYATQSTRRQHSSATRSC